MKKHTQSPYESSKVSYKPSGIKWLGEIPKHWEVTKFKYFYRSNMGETILTQDLETDGIPVYSATEEDKFFGKIKNPVNILNVNDFVIPARGTIGAIKIVKEKSTCTQTTIFSKQFKDINPYYVYYFLLGYRKFLFEFIQTAIPQITISQVNENPIILPPLQEQKEIAEFLDKKCEKIQNYINKKQKLITLLQEKKQALINEAVCGRVACHTERSEVSTTAYKPSGIEYLGLIPHHWEVKKLKHICKINPQANETLPNNFVYIDLESVIKGQLLKEQVINKEQAPSRAQRILQKQDILFQLVRPYQRNNYIFNKNGDYVASTGYAQIRTKECVNFVYYALLENSFVERVILKSTGSNYPAITSNDFADLKIPLPPLQEQKQIANFLDKKCEKINSVIEKTKKQIELIKEYKNTLINEAVCGRINLERK
ncbi:restriction endonuclease subunit S [Campylobacter upsaliensis]|nr:restriction endonuclease subunit S [Campylobacter upsaliensis]